MKRIILSILVMLTLNSLPVLANETASDFYVKVKILTSYDGQTCNGMGGFYVDQNEYGRLESTFPEGLNNFSMTVSGGKQSPISYLRPDKDMLLANGNPFIMVDIYLKPSLTQSGNTHFSGFICKLTKITDRNDPSYMYTEEKFEFDLSSDGNYDFPVYSNNSGDYINLQISAEKLKGVQYKSEDTRHIIFDQDYSLLNLETGKEEAHRNCSLGFGSDPDEDGQCIQLKLIPLTGSDTLLFISLAEIGDLEYNKNGTVTFDLEISHVYALNPENYTGLLDDLESEKATIVLLTKTITAGSGEKVEIEIPADKNSLMPFDFKEIMFLTPTINK